MALNFNSNTPKKVNINIKNSGIKHVARVAFNSLVVWMEKVLTKLTGYPITLTNSVGDDLVDYKIYGESVQDSTPTPDNPIEIESVGEKTINLLKLYDNLSQTKNGVEVKVSGDGTIVCNGLCTANIDLRIAQFDFELDTQYFCNGCPANGSTSTYRMFFDNVGSDVGQGIVKGNSEFLGSYVRVLIYQGYECKNLTFKPMIVKGSTKLDYEPRGYKIPVKVSGKNLFDKTKFSSIGYLNYDGSHVYQYNWKISDYIVINGVDYITETYPLLGGSVAYTCFYDSNKNFLSSKLQGNVTNKTIDIPQGSVYMRFCYKIADENDVQVEVGTQSTSYEPYVEPIITNIYLNEPLRKLGDYIDYVDFENKKVLRNVFCRTFTGGETINVPGTTIEGYTPFRFIGSVDISYPFVCNYLPFVNSNYGSVTNRECLARYSSSGKQMFFVISNQRIPLNDTTAFKNWLKELYSSGKPIKVYAGLNTPTEETIELPNIPTHEGTNIIELDTTIQPSNMEVQYYAKGV